MPIPLDSVSRRQRERVRWRRQIDPALACPATAVNLYESVRGVTASRAASTGRTYLPGLGGFFNSAEFEVIVCGDCGFMHLHASPAALEKLPRSSKWRRV